MINLINFVLYKRMMAYLLKRIIMRAYKFFFSSLALAALVACGGGGGGSDTGNNGSSGTMSGTVAVGAPLLGATVTVYDSKGAVVGTTTTDATTGAYSLSVGSNFVGPFTVKAQGDVGDASVTLYSTSATVGVTQVNPITHAIASSLDPNGSASSLEAGTSKTSTDITTAQTAYSTLLADPLSKLGISGSLLSSSFSDAYDKLLDNLSIKVSPSGETLISTSAGTQSNDLAEASTASNAFSYVKVAAGALPQASSASSITGLSSSQSLSVKDLAPLVQKLQTCFNKDHTQRGTNTSPDSACQHLDAADGGDVFLHNGVYWIDNTTTAGTNCQSKNTYCQGMFGWMLGYGLYSGQTDNRYDGITFGTPKIIRSLDANTWVVRFPFTYSNGMVSAFGDAVGNTTMVVRKYPSLVTSTDTGWRLLGDQRKVSSYVSAVAQKVVNAQTGKVRYETGLNFYVNGYQLRSFGDGNSPAKFVQKAVITGAGLPNTGITLYNKGSLPNDYGWNNACGGFVPLALTSQATASVTPSYAPGGVALAASSVSCSGVLRLSFGGDNPVTTANTSFLAGWKSPAPTTVADIAAENLNDSAIDNIKYGEIYTFTITISDGTVLTYKNRLENSVLNLAATQKLEYPDFTDATVTALKTYTGQSNFNAAWKKTTNSRVYNAAIYWSRGTYSNTQSLSGSEISAAAKTLTCGTGAINDAQAPSCNSAANWTNSGNASTAGIIQVRSRTADGFEIFSQIRQY